MKVTTVICKDGKRHSWKLLYRTGTPSDSTHYHTKWCRKCGCVTEFFSYGNHEKLRRCVNDDGSYYIEIPKHLK